MKAMYRKGGILSSIISIELLLRRSYPKLPPAISILCALSQLGPNPSIDSHVIRDKLRPLFRDKRFVTPPGLQGDAGHGEPLLGC
jgi:hypothetical protein